MENVSALCTLPCKKLQRNKSKKQWGSYFIYTALLSCFVLFVPFFMGGGGDSSQNQVSGTGITPQQESKTELPREDFFIETMSFWKEVRDGHLDNVKQFIEKTPELVNATLDKGETALHIAARKDHSHVIEYLIAMGADVNAKKENGNTPVCEVIPADTAHIFRTVTMMVSKGADIHVQNNEGNTLLHLSCLQANSHTSYQLAEFFVNEGLSVHTANKKGQTPLHLAVWSGHVNIVQMLIAQGAEINPKDKEGLTPLASAKSGKPVHRYGSFDAVVKVLEQKGGTE